MNDKIIEPSEIIVEQADGGPKQNIAHANPWIRCIARFLDYALFFLLLLSTRAFFHGKIPFSTYEYWIPFEFFLWIPIEALLLASWGTTPGKFFLRTKLRLGKRERFDLMSAFRRSFAVWIRGIGLGIPVLSFFCLLTAYNRLKIFQITSWDRDDHVTVTHYPIGKWRLYTAVAVTIAATLYYYSEKNSGLFG